MILLNIINESILFKNKIDKDLDKLFKSYETLETENIQLFENFRDHLLSIGFTDFQIEKRVEQEITNTELKEDDILSKTNIILRDIENSPSDSSEYHDEKCQFYNVTTIKDNGPFNVSCQTSRINDKTQINLQKTEIKNSSIIDDDHKQLCACLINQKLKSCGQCSMIKMKWLHDFLKKGDLMSKQESLNESSKSYKIDRRQTNKLTSPNQNTSRSIMESSVQISCLPSTLPLKSNKQSKIHAPIEIKKTSASGKSNIKCNDKRKRRKKRFYLNLPTSRKHAVINSQSNGTKTKLINDPSNLSSVTYENNSIDESSSPLRKPSKQNSPDRFKTNAIQAKSHKNKDERKAKTNAIQAKSHKYKDERKVKKDKKRPELFEKTKVVAKTLLRKKKDQSTYTKIKTDNNVESVSNQHNKTNTQTYPSNDKDSDQNDQLKLHKTESQEEKFNVLVELDEHIPKPKHEHIPKPNLTQNEVKTVESTEPNEIKRHPTDAESNEMNIIKKPRKFLSTNDLNVTNNTANQLQASSAVESVMSIYNRRFKSKGVDSNVNPDTIKNLLVKYVVK